MACLKNSMSVVCVLKILLKQSVANNNNKKVRSAVAQEQFAKQSAEAGGSNFAEL